jgi:hypothetical protein
MDQYSKYTHSDPDPAYSKGLHPDPETKSVTIFKQKGQIRFDFCIALNFLEILKSKCSSEKKNQKM